MLRSNQSSQFPAYTPYIGNNADLLKNLTGQEGTFDVLCKDQSFVTNVEDIPEHSPVLTSLIPTGQRNVWIITRIEPQAAGVAGVGEGTDQENNRSRAASAR